MKAAAATGILIACSLPVAAEEVSEQRGCFTSEATVIDRAGDVVIGQSEVRGVTDSIPPGVGPWDKTTHHCRSVWTNSKAGYEFSNRCTNVDRDGDKFFTMAFGSSLKSFKWVYLAGTGKYAGISGGGEASVEEVYPRATPTVGGACWRGKGSYTLKK